MFPSESELVLLTVEADPGTEIFLIDHAFRRRAKGLGRLSEQVEPGLYKIKYRAGRLIEEEHMAVRPGEREVVVRRRAMSFGSAAPLANTARTRTDHELAAHALSQRTHHRAGTGSHIFVFARRVDTPLVADGVGPGHTLSLYDAHERLIFDFGTDGKVDSSPDGSWAGANVEVDPGTYRLRVATARWGPLERTVIASPNWQTQVFLLQSDYGEAGQVELRADLASSCVLLAQARGFEASLEGAREVELVRAGLAAGRIVVPAEELLVRVQGNPMLGLLGAHALLLADDPDLRTIGAVAQAVGDQIGPHPDVDALHLAAGGGDDRVFEHPPMLTSSWRRIVAASWERQWLIPTASLAARVATGLWGYGPWLIWLLKAADRPAVPGSRTLDDALGKVADMVGDTAPPVPLTAAETALLSELQPGSGLISGLPAESDQAKGAPTGEVDVARAIQLPPATVKEVAESLIEKLSDQPMLEPSLGSPATGARFWGREREVAEVRDYLADGQSLLLEGPRRIGKTSVLRRVVETISPTVTALFVNVEQLATPAELFAAIAAAASEDTNFRRQLTTWFGGRLAVTSEISAGKMKVHLQAAMTERWRDDARAIVAALAAPDRPVVVAIDEIPLLVERILERDPSEAELLLGVLRGAAAEFPTVRWLLSGATALEPILHRAGLTGMITYLRTYRLEAWDAETTTDAVAALGRRADLQLSADAAASVHAKIGLGVPYHVQVLMDEVRRDAERRGDRSVSEEDVERVYRGPFLSSAVRPHLLTLESRLLTVLDEADEMQLARDMLTQAAVTGVLQASDALSLAGELADQEAQHPERLREILDILRDDAYLDHGALGWSIRSRVIQDWWRQRSELGFVPVAERSKRR